VGGIYLIVMQITAIPVARPLQKRKKKKKGKRKVADACLTRSKVAALAIRSHPNSSMRRGCIQMSTPVNLYQKVSSSTGEAVFP
jgi:hypothetical protein